MLTIRAFKKIIFKFLGIMIYFYLMMLLGCSYNTKQLEIHIEPFSKQEAILHFKENNVDSILMGSDQNQSCYYILNVKNNYSNSIYFPGINAYGIEIIYPYEIDSYKKKSTDSKPISSSLLDLFKPYDKFGVKAGQSKYFLSCFNMPEVGNKQVLKFYYQSEVDSDDFLTDSIFITTEKGKIINSN